MSDHAEQILNQLSPRQRQVLAGWALGKSAAQMSAELGIAVKTVNQHLRRARVALPVELSRKPPPDVPRCANCRKRDPRPGLRTCVRCAAVNVQSQRTIHAARAAGGLCAVCGERPRRERYTDCAPCAQARNAKRTAQRQQRIKDGRCQECGLRPPVLIGNMACLCLVCGKRHLRSQLKRGQRRDNPLAEGARPIPV